MTTIRFETLFDSLTWTEADSPPSLASSPSTITSPPRITHVRTERSFHAPPADDQKPVFVGQGVTDYILVYEALPEGTERHAVQADYGGVSYMEGTFYLKGISGGEKHQGALVMSVTKGRYQGSAKGEWKVISGSLRGELEGKVIGGTGGYESVGMKDSPAWIELTFEA